jgi:NADH-quinone oxidoreductase subunit H
MTAALLGIDPLFAPGAHWVELLIVVVRVLVAFVVLLVSVMLMIWFERKVISDMQSRIGPNRAGPWGLLQTLADGIKLFFKEDLLPERADSFVFKLAPYLASAAHSPSPATASSCRWSTRPSASCSCWPCPRCRSTA